MNAQQRSEKLRREKKREIAIRIDHSDNGGDGNCLKVPTKTYRNVIVLEFQPWTCEAVHCVGTGERDSVKRLMLCLGWFFHQNSS